MMYQCGRVITYVVSGYIAGTVGHLFNNAGLLIGIDKIAAIIMGVVLILSGLSLFLNAPVRFLSHSFFGSFISRFHALVTKRVIEGSTWWSLLLGLCSTLLPCGWLYTYLALAAGVGSGVEGALLMFVFWIGTLPPLVIIGTVARTIVSPFKNYIPRVISLLMICAGIFSLSGHIGLIPLHSNRPSQQHSHCH